MPLPTRFLFLTLFELACIFLKSRSGGKVRRGFEGGQMPLQKRIPKYGFSSRANQYSEEVRLSEIVKLGKKNIDIAILRQSKLIKKRSNRVKVILDESTEKTINLSGITTSSSVKNIIEKAGGTVK